MDRVTTWSYGGGTQSLAIAILVSQGRLPKPSLAVMVDTAREASETWEYHERYAVPLLASIGLTVEIASHDLATVDLYSHKGQLLIPAYTGTSGKLDTFCSNEWKARVVQRHLRSKGYGPKRPVVTWLGMSLDEVERLRPSSTKWQKHHWPLCFDARMTRGDCIALIHSFGWPDPPKSSCWMCPYRRNAQWTRLRDHYPEDWDKAVKLDQEIRERDSEHAIYLHHSHVPLDQANLDVDEIKELPLFGCDTGFCWT